MAQEQQVFSLSRSRRALDERWQPRLWLAALLTGAAGLAGAGFHRLELLGPDAAASVGGITIGLLALAATTQVVLSFYLGDRTRWIGIASGTVTAGLLPIAGSLPLFGIVWPGLALIGGATPLICPLTCAAIGENHQPTERLVARDTGPSPDDALGLLPGHLRPLDQSF